MKTAYDIGREHAEWLRDNDQEGCAPVDVDTLVSRSVYIPEGDYQHMLEHGIEPNARQYWNGFNSIFE